MNILDILEAAYTPGDIIGTITHTFSVNNQDDAYRLAHAIHSPKTGWHAKVEHAFQGDTDQVGQYSVKILVNVNPKDFE